MRSRASLAVLVCLHNFSVYLSCVPIQRTLPRRDVLNVLGMYPGDPGPPGGDCAGVVIQTGAGVTNMKQGKAGACLQ